MKQIGMFDDLQSKEFFKLLRSGEQGSCPCCLRMSRIWKYRLHSTLAVMLINLSLRAAELHSDPCEFVHIEAFKPATRTGNDFSIVKHWGLAESKPADGEEDKVSSGMWRLTDKGFLFTRNKMKIKKYALVFGDKFMGFEGDEISIKESIGKKFSYEALLSNEE